MDNKGKKISGAGTFPINNTNTTLAQDLNNGDTTVYLTSAANWRVSKSFGIIESAAYKDTRALVDGYRVSAVDTTNNTITIPAWNGGTYKAGSQVKEFDFSSENFYMFWNASNYPTNWTKYSEDFLANTSQYKELLEKSNFLKFLWQSGQMKLADLRLENLSEPQARIPSEDEYNTSKSSVNQYGQLNTGMLSEGFLPVRYIRDYVNGSTANNDAHWCEIQAYDRWGRNVAFASDGEWNNGIYDSSFNGNTSRYGLNKLNTTTYKPMHVITQGTPEPGFLVKPSGLQSVTIDMGIIHYIDKIKVWHYYPDSRTYHNTKTEVSVDGVNWVTVFDSAIEGEYQETSAGHTITFDKLGTLYHASMKKGGETLIQDVIED